MEENNNNDTTTNQDYHAALHMISKKYNDETKGNYNSKLKRMKGYFEENDKSGLVTINFHLDIGGLLNLC